MRAPDPEGDDTRSGPRDRDAYVDLLRVASIGLVVFGHWLELVADSLRPLVPWTPWITWLFQVIPTFFIVGGFANAGSWSRAAHRGETASLWLRRRAQRLLAPLFPLVVFWALLTPALIVVGLPPSMVRLASQVALVPIWFLGAYLVVIALVPVTWKLHRRFGAWAVLGFLCAAALVDALVRLGAPLVANLNLVFVWAGIHQMGYFWHDSRLPSRASRALAWALTGFAALLCLVTIGGYPVSMVVVQAGAPNNVSPPTLALFALALVQLGIVLAVRRPLTHWLERPHVRSALNTVGSVTLTLFLWHMTAIVLTGGVAYVMGLWPEAPLIEASGWATRPSWVIAGSTLLVVLVLGFRRFERGSEHRPRHARPMSTTLGLVATLAGITWLAPRGLYAPGASWEVSVLATATLLGGLAALGALPLKAGCST